MHYWNPLFPVFSLVSNNMLYICKIAQMLYISNAVDNAIGYFILVEQLSISTITYKTNSVVTGWISLSLWQFTGFAGYLLLWLKV